MTTNDGCDACRVDAQALTNEEIQRELARSPGWELAPRAGMPVICRRYTFPDFASALAFTNRVGALAESKGHHPELITEWGVVTVSWWSHKLKGLHELDFVLARACDALAA